MCLTHYLSLTLQGLTLEGKKKECGMNNDERMNE